MVLPNWDALPVRTKRSRKRLYALIASELSLTAWKSLPNNVKRSKIHLYNYIASAKNLEEYDELAKNNMRSTRLLYTYIKENASGSKPTLTVKVKDGDDNVSGATVTIGTTEKTTDASGETTFTLDYDDYLVEVSKSGYVDYEENIKFRANHKSFTLNIEAEPEPPVTTGTVTVTALVDDGDVPYPLEEGFVVLATAPVDLADLDMTKIVAGCDVFDETGTGELLAFDPTTHTPTESKDIPFGTYYLCASNGMGWEYSGTLTVDGDEEVTITLIPIDGGK